MDAGLRHTHAAACHRVSRSACSDKSQPDPGSLNRDERPACSHNRPRAGKGRWVAAELPGSGGWAAGGVCVYGDLLPKRNEERRETQCELMSKTSQRGEAQSAEKLPVNVEKKPITKILAGLTSWREPAYSLDAKKSTRKSFEETEKAKGALFLYKIGGKYANR